MIDLFLNNGGKGELIVETIYSLVIFQTEVFITALISKGLLYTLNSVLQIDDDDEIMTIILDMLSKIMKSSRMNHNDVLKIVPASSISSNLRNTENSQIAFMCSNLMVSAFRYHLNDQECIELLSACIFIIENDLQDCFENALTCIMYLSSRKAKVDDFFNTYRVIDHIFQLKDFSNYINTTICIIIANTAPIDEICFCFDPGFILDYLNHETQDLVSAAATCIDKLAQYRLQIFDNYNFFSIVNDMIAIFERSKYSTRVCISKSLISLAYKITIEDFHFACENGVINILSFYANEVDIQNIHDLIDILNQVFSFSLSNNTSHIVISLFEEDGGFEALKSFHNKNETSSLYMTRYWKEVEEFLVRYFFDTVRLELSNV